jgi:hypothetical protein
MIKNNLSNIFTDLNSESSVILPKSIKIKNINSVDTIANTTSSFMPQDGGYSDATSSFMPQKGGYLDVTSSFMPQKGGYLNGTKNNDIKQLISMLSATSDDNYTANYTANSTDNTEQLKDKLFNILQSGGAPPPTVEQIQQAGTFLQNFLQLYEQNMTTGMKEKFALLEYPVQVQVLNLIELLKIDTSEKNKLTTTLFTPPAVPPFSGTPQQLVQKIIDTNKDKKKRLGSIKNQ